MRPPALHTLPDAVCCRQAAPCCEVCEPCSVFVEYHVGYDEECSHALFGHHRECAVELVRTSRLQELKLHSQRPGRDAHFSYRKLGTVSLSSSSCLMTISRPALPDTPVTFPPGRARLAMSPVPTGSRTPI